MSFRKQISKTRARFTNAHQPWTIVQTLMCLKPKPKIILLCVTPYIIPCFYTVNKTAIKNPNRINLPSPHPEWCLFYLSLLHIFAARSAMRADLLYWDGLYLTRIHNKYVKRYLGKLKDFMIRNKPVNDNIKFLLYSVFYSSLTSFDLKR